MNLMKFIQRFSLFTWDDKTTPTLNDRLDPKDNPGVAGLIGSQSLTDPTKHRVVLDIDLPCMLLESTNGNYHLLIDKELSFDEYSDLVSIMTDVGLLNPTTHEKFLVNKATYVRTPWRLKPPHIKIWLTDSDGRPRQIPDSGKDS